METLAVLASMAVAFAFLVFVIFLFQRACLWARSLFVPKERRKQFWEEIKQKEIDKKAAKKQKQQDQLKYRELVLKYKAEREGKEYKEGAAQAEKNGAAVVMILIFIAFIWFVTGDGDGSDKPIQMSDEMRQTVWIEKSKDGVRARLKDPDSAKFKDVFFSKASGTPVACGQVNSKNALGGYGGYQYFVASGEQLAFFQNETKGFAKVWAEMCGG